MPKSAIGEEALRLCKAHPNAPSRTLARRIAKEFKCSIEQARTAVRRYRGNSGNHHRKSVKQGSFRLNQPPGWKPAMPDSLADEWSPFELGNGIGVAVLSDIHAPFHDDQALSAAVRNVQKRTPDVVVLNGDIGDWYSISRFAKNPKHRDFKGELQIQRDMLAYVRGQFRKARIILKKGNHDERWDHYIWNFAAELSDDPLLSLDAWLHCEKVGVEVVGDQRPIMAGKLPIFHGHELTKGLATPVNPARGAFMKMIASTLVGHSHRTSQHTEPNWRHEEIACWSTGCLCNLRPEYNRVSNRWNHGAAFVEVASDGEFDVDNFRISDGKVRKS